jgi:hypothetical protein
LFELAQGQEKDYLRLSVNLPFMTLPSDDSTGDQGHLNHSEPFPFHEIDGEELKKDLAGYSYEEIEKAMNIFGAVLRWMWQDGRVKENGMGVRATIVCWLFMKELRGYSQSDIAKSIGKKKQSLGRWAMNFRKTFNFKAEGQKCDDALVSYRKREAAK